MFENDFNDLLKNGLRGWYDNLSVLEKNSFQSFVKKEYDSLSKAQDKVNILECVARYFDAGLNPKDLGVPLVIRWYYDVRCNYDKE